MKSHACLRCGNLDMSNASMLSPITDEHPHLSATCSVCPFKDTYGFPPHKGSHYGPLPIWVNLETMEAWVDGSSAIPKEGCKNFNLSNLIRNPKKKKRK